MFVALDETVVTAQCNQSHVGISAIEPLPAGGVRLVCMSSDGATKMRKKFKAKLMADDSLREKFRPTKPLW